MYQKKKAIVEQEVQLRFWHLHIYRFVKFMFLNYSLWLKLMWFLFVGLALIGMVMEIDHPVFVNAVKWWFIIWIAMIFMAGMDRMWIDFKLMRIYHIAAERCEDELENPLHEVEYRAMLKDIIKE